MGKRDLKKATLALQKRRQHNTSSHHGQPDASSGGGVQEESVSDYLANIKQHESISSAQGMRRGQMDAHAHTKSFIRNNLPKIFEILGRYDMYSGRCHGEGGALGQIEGFERDIRSTGKIARLKGDKKNNLDKPGMEGSVDRETEQPVTTVIATAWRLACQLDQRQKESMEYERECSGMNRDERVAAEIQDEEEKTFTTNRMMVYTQLADNIRDGGGCEPGIIARLWPVLVNMAEEYVSQKLLDRAIALSGMGGAGADQGQEMISGEPNRMAREGAAEELSVLTEDEELKIALALSAEGAFAGQGAEESGTSRNGFFSETSLTRDQAELLTRQLDEYVDEDEANLAQALMMSMK